MSAVDALPVSDGPRSSVRGASLRLLRSELRLIMGRRRNQAGLLVLAAVPILLAVALKMSDPRGRGVDRTSSRRPRPTGSSSRSLR